MKARAVRLHAKNDIRLDEFELPPITDDEILVKVVSDCICMSTYKTVIQGVAHKRVHEDVAEHPAILGHEFAGDIVEVGINLRNRFRPGMKYTIQPALNYKGSMWSPGYSYEFFGGDTTYCIIPKETFEVNCFLEYRGEAYYEASLAEPMSCNIGAVNACYHGRRGSYKHEMGIKPDGKMAILAGAGPMGLGCITYVLNRKQRPSILVITDVDQARLDRASKFFPAEYARERGVELHFVNIAKMSDSVAELNRISGGTGYDDVFVYASIATVVEQASDILGSDGCFNFFSGPTDTKFKVPINFYDVHYNATHIIGTTGGSTDDMLESLQLTEEGKIDPAVMVTHVGGLDSVAETTLHLPEIPGGKKLIYTHLEMPLTALSDFRKLAKESGEHKYALLADIIDDNNGLWSLESEKFLLEEFV
ncbi:MAG: zinc-binding dehydrogenase [Eggerthellaceae bacterium]|nr:zinc-binding dehydrogenase [Eggerthellaceae bacterium]